MACSTSTSIQTVLFDRTVYRSKKAMRSFLRRNKFKSRKLDCNDRTCRARQRDPSQFCRGTFRTIPLRRRGAGGVKAVIGKRRA